jgi:citrate lyase subunit beta/citryl-CoA lyase
MRLRSYLFVPGNRPERFFKACSSGADAIIIDLEDAIPSEEKGLARESVASWLSAEHPAYIRINGSDTEWFEDDVSVLHRPGVAGVVLPKAGERDEVARLASRLPPCMRIIPIAETALGIWNALPLATAPKVERIAFGSIDLQLDTGITGDGEELHFARSRIVFASRIAGILPPLDGVTTAIDDPEFLTADVQRARKFGFGGKLCIHPKQVKAVNDGFLPTEPEIKWALRVVEAVNSRGDGAISLDGKMVDRPVIDKAKKILEAAGKFKS